MAAGTQVASLADIKPKMKLNGVVKQIQLAGAIVDVGIDACDGLLHISQIRRKRVNNVRDVLTEGQEVEVWVRAVDQDNARLDLTMIEPSELSWSDIKEGASYTGKVVRIEKFGVFVDIGAERPGLVHISELTHGFVGSPDEVVEKGEEVEVKVIGINRRKNQIDLSMKAATAEPRSTESSEEEALPTAMALAFQQAMGDGQATESGDDDATENKRKVKKDKEQDDIMRRTLERHESDN